MKTFLNLTFVILLWSCSPPGPLDEPGLYQFIRNEQNGLMKVKESNGFSLALIYKPAELIAKQQLGSSSRKEFDSLVNHFSKYLYFTLEMTYHGKDLETAFGSDPGSFADKISFLSSDFAQDIQLTSEKDTLSVLDFVYSRSYGMGVSTCMMVFEKPKGEDFTIMVSGNKIGFDLKEFLFQKSKIENAPKLKLKLI